MLGIQLINWVTATIAKLPPRGVLFFKKLTFQNRLEKQVFIMDYYCCNSNDGIELQCNATWEHRVYMGAARPFHKFYHNGIIPIGKAGS